VSAEVLKVGVALRVLEAVAEFPDFLALELSRRTGVRPGTVSIRLAALAEAGLITRTRRSGLILNRITPAGVEALAAARQPASPALPPESKPAGPGRQRAARAEVAIRSTSLSKEEAL